LAKKLSMAKKSSGRKINKRNTRKDITIKQLILIVLASVIVLAFLFFSIYIPNRKKPIANKSSAFLKSAPSFRHDGNLSIIASQHPSPIKIDIEIVDNEEERMRGLMDRHDLPEKAGMLFIFPDEEPRSFWMKNTFISLDIIYINANKEIVSIQKYTQPKSTYSLPSEKPAKYVLEVNAGFTDKYEINPGDKIEFYY
jgi:uncharacterized membrane protein (UPF0127 family)